MAVGTLAPLARQFFIDASGNPYAGGSLSTFLAGLSTPVATYSDVGLTVANDVIMTLNAAGRPTTSGTEVAIFLAADTSYKFVLKDILGATIWTQDNVASVATATIAALTVTGVSTLGTLVALSNTPGAGSVVLSNTTTTDWGLRQNSANSLCFDYFSGAAWTQWLAIGNDGVLTSAGFGNHSIIAGGVGGNELRVQNNLAGAGNFTSLRIGNDTNATAVSVTSLSSTYTTSTFLVQDGGALSAANAGGLSVAATHASGVLRFYAGGTTERMRIGTTGAVGIISGQKFYLDGVALTGDTYIEESGANVVRWTIGGNIVAQLTSTIFSWYGGQASPDFQFTTTGSSAVASVSTRAFGTGNVTGPGLSVGRNSSGSGAAGYLRLTALDGTSYYLWVDATGDLRIGTAPPDEDGTPADTSGTVVGTQT